MPREDYIATIGLEVHCQITANSKMFCGCLAGYGHEPNTNVCPVCLGLPGALPVLNKHAIEQTILAGMLLNCRTPEISKWDRKNYFYPDMPMEIVTEPDIDTADEAYAFLKSLQQILIYGGISDADMEKGQMRCDVNISVRPVGTDELGTKLEVKNLNSITAVRKSIEFEIQRQCDEYDQGIEQKQATIRWDDAIGETVVMRIKEDSADYRYFPEPDLLPVRTADIVAKMRSHVPELPGVLTSEKALADYFEVAAKGSKVPKKVANWVINALLGKLNETEIGIEENPVPAESLAALVGLVEAGTISNNQAKDVFVALWEAPEKAPADIAKSMGFEPADNSAIEAIIDEVIAANPDKVAEITGGNPKMANWLTGQVMKASKGKANPKMVTDSITAKLGL